MRACPPPSRSFRAPRRRSGSRSIGKSRVGNTDNASGVLYTVSEIRQAPPSHHFVERLLAASSVLPRRKRRNSRRCRYALQQFPPTQALRRTATGSRPVAEIVGTTLGSKDFLDESHFRGRTVAWGLNCRRRSSIRVTPVCPHFGRNWLRQSAANSRNEIQEAANCRARDQVFRPGSDAAVSTAIRHYT